MRANLWSSNAPSNFWLCRPEIQGEQWQLAIQKALPVLGLSAEPIDADHLMALVLGEEQFGSDHWRLSSIKRLYYLLKPIMPHRLTRRLRKFHNPFAIANHSLGWPIEDRYARFQWEVMKQLLLAVNQTSISFRSFWPDGYSYAFVITHDIETNKGQEYAEEVADLDECFGFCSCFNFVPEQYPINHNLLENLKERGFEIGLHGLKHDGKLFNSYSKFIRDVKNINSYLKELEAAGFRSPLTLRNPEWMQALEIDYDLSFFDTDPYEPMPGGTMSIWPFMIGRFVELPYTLVQDNTLLNILGEKTPRLWLEKVDFIEKYHGMALINAHPDYLKDSSNRNVYIDFLRAMKQRNGYWNALPREIARWWRIRSTPIADQSPAGVVLGRVQLTSSCILVSNS